MTRTVGSSPQLFYRIFSIHASHTGAYIVLWIVFSWYMSLRFYWWNSVHVLYFWSQGSRCLIFSFPSNSSIVACSWSYLSLIFRYWHWAMVLIALSFFNAHAAHPLRIQSNKSPFCRSFCLHSRSSAFGLCCASVRLMGRIYIAFPSTDNEILDRLTY